MYRLFIILKHQHTILPGRVPLQPPEGGEAVRAGRGGQSRPRGLGQTQGDGDGRLPGHAAHQGAQHLMN